ncbi:hypothetical protein LNQ03_15545 [Klebsiella pneumoniae subsp. pneumoniae]|nr:hypothetical protein [Klebsiella pneumoniae subsp. pneumoniae]
MVAARPSMGKTTFAMNPRGKRGDAAGQTGINLQSRDALGNRS